LAVGFNRCPDKNFIKGTVELAFLEKHRVPEIDVIAKHIQLQEKE